MTVTHRFRHPFHPFHPVHPVRPLFKKLSATALAALAELLLFFAAGLARAADVQKRTLLTTGGTLFQARAGTVADLGITDLDLDADTYVVEWSSVAQDGTRQQGVLQGSLSGNPKTNLDLTFDEPTGSLVILWREDAAIMNQIQLAVLRSGQWSFAGLLPHIGFPYALNPRMLLSHQTVTTLDDKGKQTSKNRSTLSVIWWEEAQYAQARYAPIFLDESIDSDSLKIYDLPVLIGGGGPTSYNGVAPAAYDYPALQLEGPSGAFLASFADLHARKQYVVRIDFPTNLGRSREPDLRAPPHPGRRHRRFRAARVRKSDRAGARECSCRHDYRLQLQPDALLAERIDDALPPLRREGVVRCAVDPPQQ
jgi:hypothetical protein